MNGAVNNHLELSFSTMGCDTFDVTYQIFCSRDFTLGFINVAKFHLQISKKKKIMVRVTTT